MIMKESIECMLRILSHLFNDDSIIFRTKDQQKLLLHKNKEIRYKIIRFSLFLNSSHMLRKI